MAERPAPRPRPAGSPPKAPSPPAPAPAAPAPAEPSPFAFQPTPTGSVLAGRRKKATPVWQTAALGLAGVAVVGAIGFGAWTASRPAASNRSLAVQLPPERSVPEMVPIAWRVGVAGVGVDPAALTYSLVNPPAGAAIDPKTGELTWTPSEAQGPGTHPLTVRVEAAGPEPLSDEKTTVVTVTEVRQAPEIAAVEEQVIDGKSPVALTVKADDPDGSGEKLTFLLEENGPKGATIDPATGAFAWTPDGVGPGLYSFTVRVEKPGPQPPNATRTLVFRVPEPERMDPIAALVEELREGGRTATLADRPALSGVAATARTLTSGDQSVLLLSFPSAGAVDPIGAKLASEPAAVLGDAYDPAAPLAVYRDEDVLALYSGSDQGVLDALTARFGLRYVSVEAKAMVAEAPPATPADVQTLLDLREKKTLFNVKTYPVVRKIFADRFEQEQADKIKFAFGDYYDEMTKWLNERPDIKEELYTAIDPAHDDVVAALKLFKQLKDAYPQKIEPYSELATAVSVVWDADRRGVYDYEHHARRTHSNYGGELLDGPGNFEYFTAAEKQMQGRAQFLPREFLVLLVDHRTPDKERDWAMQGYGANRAMFGKIYSDVPYDTEMLETESKVCKLAGKDYDLPNILTLGGVCAMQADFAARVGKSLGVPAAYVGGESIYGDRHAWVMWVELKSVTKAGISFTLESHGRYRGDKYYVGELDDPQTGERITDRDLERRLQTVGMNPTAARQAKLIMKAYPALAEAAGMDVGERIVFLQSVVGLSPGNEAAWVALAQLPKEGKIAGDDYRLMLTSFDRLFRTFAALPDFTWTVFDDLTRFVDNPRQRGQLYEKLIVLYEAAGRPDLACEARLRHTQHLLEEDRTADAVAGLAATIKKFPDEGRYVPRLLDELESVCDQHPGTGPQLVRFYTEFLPAVPRTRGGTPSKYCIELYERAIALFQKHDQPQLAQALSTELAKIKAGGGR